METDRLTGSQTKRRSYFSHIPTLRQLVSERHMYNVCCHFLNKIVLLWRENLKVINPSWWSHCEIHRYVAAPLNIRESWDQQEIFGQRQENREWICREGTGHELINYIDTKAKCRQKCTCKETLRQVFIWVYRLETQSVSFVGIFDPTLWTNAPVTFSLVKLSSPPFPVEINILYTRILCVGFWSSDR
jgi:hypothetical protein